jgi:hypothetical protein
VKEKAQQHWQRYFFEKVPDFEEFLRQIANLSSSK